MRTEEASGPAGGRFGRLERGIGGHRGAELGLGRRQSWPHLGLAGQAAGSSDAAAEQRQDGTAGSGSHGDSKQGGEPGLRRDGGGGAAWPSHDWELERLEELEEARCGGGAAAAMELSPALAMRA